MISQKRFRYIAVVAALAITAALSCAGEKKKTKIVEESLLEVDALAIADVHTIYYDLSQSHGSIGVSVAPTDAVLRAHLNLHKDRPGLVVTNVIAKSLAAKAGMVLNDILLAGAGKPLASARDLSQQVAQSSGKNLEFELLRNGKLLKLRIAIPAKKKEDPKHALRILWTAEGASKYVIGIHTKPVDPALAAQLVIPPSKGLVITQVEAKMPAAKAGLQVHDVILTVADNYATSSADIGKALDAAKGKAVKLEFVRGGRKHSCNVTPVKRRDKRVIWTVSPTIRYWDTRTGKPIPHVQRFSIYDQATLAAGGKKPLDLQTQINRLSTQITELQRTLNALKKTIGGRGEKKEK